MSAPGLSAPARPLLARRGDTALRAAFVVSSTGDWIYRLAVPLLVLEITGSPASTAFAYALEFIPFVVLGPLAGVVADRHDRRGMMIACDGCSTAMALVIAVLAAMPHPPVVGLYVAVFALACLRPLYFPAFQGLVVEIVHGPRLPRLNAWTQTVDSALGMTGPVLGTLVVAALGTSGATAVNAASFAASALLLGTIPRGRTPRVATTPGLAGVRRDLADGLRLLIATRSIAWGTGLMNVYSLAVFMIEGNLFYLVLHVEHMSKLVLGVVFGAQGLGAVIGAMVVPRLMTRHRFGALLVDCIALSTLCFALPAALPTWWVLTISWIGQGAASSATIVLWVTARQRIVPLEAIGRIASVSRAIAYAATPVAAVLGGWLVTGGSPMRTLCTVAAVVQLVTLLVARVSPLARIDAEMRPEAAEPGPPDEVAVATAGAPPAGTLPAVSDRTRPAPAAEGAS